jgi:hypothetical protein
MVFYRILLLFRPKNGILEQKGPNNGKIQQIRPNNGILFRNLKIGSEKCFSLFFTGKPVLLSEYRTGNPTYIAHKSLCATSELNNNIIITPSVPTGRRHHWVLPTHVTACGGQFFPRMRILTLSNHQVIGGGGWALWCRLDSSNIS